MLRTGCPLVGSVRTIPFLESVKQLVAQIVLTPKNGQVFDKKNSKEKITVFAVERHHTWFRFEEPFAICRGDFKAVAA